MPPELPDGEPASHGEAASQRDGEPTPLPGTSTASALEVVVSTSPAAQQNSLHLNCASGHGMFQATEGLSSKALLRDLAGDRSADLALNACV